MNDTRLVCRSCEEEFYCDFPFGDDVKCPHCGKINETDMEESDDSLFAWTTKIKEDDK